ncbi:MAG: cell wall-binding repeat-containing protein [Coriobacteriia bacterium]
MRSRMFRFVMAAFLCAAMVPLGVGAAFGERWIDSEFPISLADNGQVQPEMDYPYVVYKAEADGHTPDIWGYNVETGENFPICTAPGEQSNPSISGGRVVYSDDRYDLNSSECNIYMYDIATGEESVICSETGGQGNPYIYGDVIVWTDGREDGNSGGDIYMYDLAVGEESVVCTAAGGQYAPTVDDRYVVWWDSRGGYSDIYAYDLQTGIEVQVTDTGSYYEYGPAIYDHKVVYEKHGGPFSVIEMTDLDTNDVTVLTTNVNERSPRHPVIRDSFVTWHQTDGTGWSNKEAWTYDLGSGEATIAVEFTADPRKSAGRTTNDGDWMVWHDHRDEGINTDGTSYDDLYMKWLGEGPAPTQEAALFGPTRYQTAVDVSLSMFPDGADTAVIATGRNWPDALSGASLAGALGGPILLVSDALPAEVADELLRLGVRDVVILGGPSAVSTAVETEIESLLELDAVRHAGINRFETACIVASATVAASGGTWDGTCFVTTGSNWPDALAAAPLAAWAGYPIFLSGPGGVSQATQDCMDTLGVTGAVVLGGTVAVPVSAFSQMRAAGVTEIDRVGGLSRYETAVLISEYGVAELGMSYRVLGIATGTNYPDALALGAPLGMQGYTMMLNPGSTLNSVTKAALEGHAGDISAIRFAGGPSAITDGVRQAIMACVY